MTTTPTREQLNALGDRAEEIYATTLRAQVETPDNIGKLLTLDVDSGDYEINDDVAAASRHLREKHPGIIPFTIRIGYNAVYSLGGAVERTAP